MYSVPLSNYLSSHSFISVWAHGHVFDTGGYNLMQCCHLDLSQSWPLGVLSACSCVALLYSHNCEIFLLGLSYFLALQDAGLS